MRSLCQNDAAESTGQTKETKHPQKTTLAISFAMRRSLTSAIFAAALLCECYALSAASPMGKAEDGGGGGGSLEQEAYASLLSNEASESAVGNGDVAAAGKSGGPRVIVVADPSLWRELLRGGAPRGGLSVFKRRSDDNGQGIEHRDAGRDLNIPILRRDPMRCMVGRVYRPCWEV